LPRSRRALAASEHQQKQIEQWLAALGTPQQAAFRCRIALMPGRGESEVAIASKLQPKGRVFRCRADAPNRDLYSRQYCVRVPGEANGFSR